MADMMLKELLPTIFTYVNNLASTGIYKKDLMPSISTKAEEKLLSRLSELADGISHHLDS